MYYITTRFGVLLWLYCTWNLDWNAAGTRISRNRIRTGNNKPSLQQLTVASIFPGPVTKSQLRMPSLFWNGRYWLIIRSSDSGLRVNNVWCDDGGNRCAPVTIPVFYFMVDRTLKPHKISFRTTHLNASSHTFSKNHLRYQPVLLLAQGRFHKPTRCSLTYVRLINWPVIAAIQ